MKLHLLFVRLFCSLIFMNAIACLRGDDTSESNGTPDLSFVKDVRPFVTRYCIACHGDEKPMAELTLSKYTDDLSVQSHRKVWDNVIQMLASREMPPQDHPQPPAAEVESVCKAIKAILANVDCGKGGTVAGAGRVTIRRLNKTEYNNTIRDLLAVSFQPADDFPADDVGYGFDNIGDVLNFSPLLAEKYLLAAEAILDEAIVIIDVPQRTRSTIGTLRPASASSKIEQSGFVTLEEGDYIIRARVNADQAGDEATKAQIRATFNDTREVIESKVFEISGAKENPTTLETTVHIQKKGSYRIGVLYLNPFQFPYDQEVDYQGELNRQLRTLQQREEQVERAQGQDQRRLARLKVDEVTSSLKSLGVQVGTLTARNIDTDGPINPPAPKKPEAFVKLMAHAEGLEPREAAREIVGRFASQAFRRPARPTEVEQCLAIYDIVSGQNQRFEFCVRAALMRVLVSPQFLFRVELDPPDIKPGEAYAIAEFELASRLSYFLWNSMPDEELFGLAAEGKLRLNLDAQVLRMVKDPKSSSFIQNFSEQWLALRKLDLASPDPQIFPRFTPELRQAMIRESKLFFEAIVRDDHSMTDLLTADFTFVNEPLARHYGMIGVSGKSFVRVSAPLHRGGILTQASILTLTSNATRTSPVKRGKFVLEQILNTPPPPPPDNVPALEEGKTLTGTLRQVMEQHRANAICASCHAKMDPLGFAFENFDATGAWRDVDGGHTIDASGQLPTGEVFSGSEELNKIIVQKQNLFVRCVTEKMLTYALGRGLEFYDQCAVDKIIEALEKNDFRFSVLLIEITRSDLFQMRMAAPVPSNGESP
jgi:hypothetical protein